MPLSNDDIIQRFDEGIPQKFLYFWGPKQQSEAIDKSCFSQWFEAPFVYEGVDFQTAEHWMMAQKALLFNDRSCYEKILQAKSPGEAKDLGRKILDFDQKIWNQHKFQIVVDGNVLKFGQHPALKTFLLNTKSRVLVEASPLDSIWGVGLSVDDPDIENPNLWQGENLLGYALMEVRTLLSQ